MTHQAQVDNPLSASQPGRFERWHRRILAFCLIVFALEIGLFLLAFPWTMWWGMNWIPAHSPYWNGLWMSRYFRGVISGLGLLNLYVAAGEFLRQVHSLFGATKH